MIKWKNQMIQLLNIKNGIINWTEIGNNMLKNIYNNNLILYDDYKIFNGLDNMYPINYDKCVDEFLLKPYENYKNIIREYQPLVVLVHSVYLKVEAKIEQDILEGNMPLNYFINKSIERCGSTINKFIFEYIYKNQIWNNGNQNVPLSGDGSSLYNAQECSKLLNDFIYNNKCNSVLDLGCGDLTWISKTPFFNDNNIKYTGIDVVEHLIISHSTTYSDKSFFCKDITTNNDFEFASLIIIRDVIFHLKNKEILSIFENIKNKFDFLMITSCKNNINTDTFDRWHFSPKNINIEPFNKQNNFTIKLNEDRFNRYIYIYTHNNFYNSMK